MSLRGDPRTEPRGKDDGFGHGDRCYSQLLDASLDAELKSFLIDEDELHTYDDLTKVNPVTPSTVLKCLQARYSVKVFYTHAGCTLVALNPFQPIPHLYSPEVMKEYHCARQPQEFKPHIFVVAEEAYRNIQGQVEPVDQSLVVSGESGAGKTWTTRCLMKYYSTIAASSSQKCQNMIERIEKRVLDSNPIMEAFGNACTSRNNNSSRFGKYIQLQLNTSQLLVGASVQTYLLEKTRVVKQGADERNFHIFYQLMKGATEEQRKEWKLPRDQHFIWLPNAERTLEEDCFQDTVAAMGHMGIATETQGQMFRMLAGLLNLGNVTFCPSADESQPCDLQEESTGFLQAAASLLLVSAEELESCLKLRVLRAGKQSVLKPCSREECGIRRDCLAKLIYARVFDWLVAFINKSMCAGSSSWCNFIGLLDVYGFECFVLNNLEQLCINYANEKLQQHFVAHYLKAQQEEYVSEGLVWSFVQYQDNQSCLHLLEGSPKGIFSLLNEECRLNRGTDSQQFRRRLQRELSGNACMSWDTFSKQPHFTVSHYAGRVSYQIEGMVEKNRDPVPPELIHMLQGSQDSLLQSLFADSNADDSSGRGHTKVVTVVSKFKNSLESLMKILHSTTPHYTRCIKPNPECRPLTFKKEEVILQLEACGIVETINISAAGFPIRIPHLCFLKRYGLMVNSKISSQPVEENVPEAGSDTVARAVVAVLNMVLRCHSLELLSYPGKRTHGSLVHCGETKAFLTHFMLELLEDHRGRVRSQRAFVIQCCWRQYCRRKRKAQARAAARIQAVVRSWLVRKEVLRWCRAATIIQRQWKGWRARMEALAEAELDDVMDTEKTSWGCTIRDRVSLQLSTHQEPVIFWAWPVGLALASAPTVTVTMTVTNIQKMVSLLACLKLSFRRHNYKVETSQFEQGVASIRAQPQESIKFHFQRSPLPYADTHPAKRGVTGFNQILLKKT